MNLPDFSIRRPVTILMGCMIAVLLGAIAFVQIPVDLMPDIVFPTLSVSVDYEGVAPEEMETLVTRPLEEAFAAAPGVERLTSRSSEGRSFIRVEFGFGTNLDEAANELRTRMDRRRQALPEDMDPPTIFKFDATQFPIMFLSLSSAEMDAKELRHFAEKSLQFRLERVPGVAQFTVRGGLRRQIHVNLDLKKLRALELSVAQVVQTLRSENLNKPVGPVREGRFEVLLRTDGEFTNLTDILNVGVTTRNGVPVYLRDIATVEDSHEDIRYFVAVNGNPAVQMMVYKQSGANTVAVSDEVWKEISRIHRDYPNVKVIATRDTADFIRASISNLRDAALMGSGLAVVVLMFFLRSMSSTMIIGTAIPVSVIATFSLMYFNGFTLNIISFGGLALGVGMLVDNAIVVLENIFRHREKGKPLKEASLIGSNEVATAITASTLTTIAVFVPVLFMGGISAQSFQQLAYVVSFSLLCSLVAALTVVPVLCSRFLRIKQPGDSISAVNSLVGRAHTAMDDRYAHILTWAIDHRKTIGASALALFVGSLYLGSLIGVELQPQADEGEVRVAIELEPGTHVSVTEGIVQDIAKVVRKNVPEIDTISTESGTNPRPFRPSGMNTGSLRIQLVEQAQRDRTAQQVAGQIRGLIQTRPGMLVRTRIGGGMLSRLTSLGGDDNDRLSVEIRGHEVEVTQSLANQVRDAMMSTPGVASAQVSRRPGQPEMVISVDRAKATSLGLRVAEVADTLETAIGGTRASMYREEGDEYDIVVRLQEKDRLDLDQVGQIPVRTPDGQTLPAESIVRMQRQEGPIEINRADQQRVISVTGTIADRDLGSVVGDLEESLGGIPKPAGYELRFGGEWEEQQEAFRAMLFAAILALVLVYMVMASQFESLRDPFIILFSIPLASIGVVLILLLTKTTFNVQGFLGVIVLVGIVVNNAIVLIDYTNLLRREQDYGLRDAVLTAGRRRLRPILMTTITTVLALIPMALGLGEGGEMQAPMARVVIGGLTTSTMITLLIIPIIYMTLEERVERGTERRQAGQLQPVESTGD